MPSHAGLSVDADLSADQTFNRGDYIPLILQAMARQNTSQRALALKTGISKTRLALLLHRTPAKRSTMTLAEFQTILSCLDISLIQAIIEVETFHGLEWLRSGRYDTLIRMLCDAFHGLPHQVVAALEELDGVDGTEVRKEWAGPLQNAVKKRLLDEISAVIDRRARFAQGDEFRI